MRGKRILSLLLILCMIVTMLPTFTMPVAAAAGEDTDISDMNALDALGIDTSKTPDGVDLDSTDNPYGRDTSTVNPVYELFVQENLTSTLYGHNKAVGGTWENFYSSQGSSNSIVTTGSYKATATDSGNFIKDSTGGNGQTVTVAAGAMSANGGLYLYFSDPVNNKKSATAIELLSTSKIIGNTGNQMNEDFNTDSYLMQNYLKLTTGDYDGDGVDEVAVYVPQQGSSRVEIYDLQIDDTFNATNAATYYLDSSHWAKAWTYYFNESPYVSNMVSVTSGDLNQDGTSDLALTWGYYYGPTKYTNSKGVILCGSKTAMLQKSMSIDLKYNNSQIVRAAFAYGDIDGDNVDDLILGGQLNSDIAAGNIYSRFVAVYTYNGDSDSFLQSVAKNFDLFAKEENDAGEEVYVYPAMSTHNNVFFSKPTMVANISAVNMRGVGYPSNIYIDSLIIEYGSKGLDITAALDQSSTFNKDANLDYDWVRSTDGRLYTEYGIVAADFTGKTAQTLQVMLNYSPESYETTISYQVRDYDAWWFWLWGYTHWTTVTEYKNFSLPSETVMAAVKGKLTEVVDSTTNTITGYNFSMDVNRRLVNPATSFCKLNSDNDTSYISYTGEHGVIYSDPKVMAVLASAPHFEDLSSDELSGSYMESSTSYSKTTGDGTENTTSNTLSIGAYVSYEHDFELPITGTKVAGMETELAYTHGWTWDTTKASMVEMTISYETVVGQDSVVFYSIPMEYYTFDSHVPIINESTGEVTGYDIQKMSVNLPHTAAVVVLPLEKYEKIAADYDELPKIAGTVLTHTVGDPSTYPSSSAGYNDVTEYDGNWAGVDYSDVGASVTQEIAITKENGDGLTNTNTVDFQIGAGPGDFILGVTAGYEHGSSKVTISSEGSTYSGTIYNMPAEAEEYGYYYAWKLFTYTYKVGNNTIPVVNYLVKDVTEPPSLSEDFAQDSTLTTDDAIGLTWSYPSNSAIAGFQIYRYYKFPDGSGSYELAFVPASQVSYTTYDSDNQLIRHYKYVDEGLADYTDYDYQIQVVRAAVPTASILSDILTARTKADKGYPTITLNGVTATTTNTYDEETGEVIGEMTDYKLLVYPDTSSTVSVSIAETYSQTPRYQWQKLTDSGWEDIAGATKSSKTFLSSGVSDEGKYRCRFNVIYEDEAVGQIYYISAYSDTFTLDYSMRTSTVVDNSFAVNLLDETVSLSLKSVHTNHTFAPSGNVTFTITGADYESSYTVALGNASSDYVTTAKLDLGATDRDNDGICVDLPDGVYEISAYYSGSRVFSSLAVSDSVYYVSGNSVGHLLNVNSSFTYGDTIAPKLMSISASSGEVVYNEVTSNVTYKVYKEQAKTVTYNWYYWFFWWNYNYSYTYTTYEYVECPDFIQPDGSVTAMAVGNYKLKAYVDDIQVAARDITVTQKDITIGFNNPLTGVSGNTSISHPTYNDLKVTSDNQLVSAYGDTLANLGLVVKAYNTAGTQVTISPSTDPGLYTIIGAAAVTPGAHYNNYNITYAPSTYTLTGPKYDMTIVSKLYGSDNAIVGTVALLRPEVKEDNGNIVSTTTTATNNSWYRDDVFTGGTAITLRATPQIGYQVKSWTVTTDNATTTTNTSSTTFAYQTTANNTTITVEYELAQNKLYFQSANSAANDGTVTAVGNSIQSGAVVQPNASYTFIATPAEGYHFVEWTLSGSTNSNFTGNYDETTGTSTTALTMGSVGTVLSAVFERDSYTLTLQSNLQASYLLDDGFSNMVSTTSTGIVTIPGDTVVTVTPKIGYSLLDSAAWYINGVSVGIGEPSCSFAITANTTVDVGTNQNTYDVSVSVSQPSTTVNNKVIVKANNAVTDFSETRSVSGGTALVFTAVPAWGYVLDHWEVNGVTSAELSKILTAAELGQNMSVVAVFKVNPSSYTVNVSNNSGGKLTYSVIYNGSGYAGNVPKDAEVAADGTNINIYKGDTVVITAAPASNYMLRNWTVGNTVYESPEKVLTLESVSANMTVAARFIPMSFTKVTYTAGSGGSITSATSDGVAFNSGASIGNGTKVVVTAAPEIGNMISYWTVDNVTVKTPDNSNFVGETLTIESLTASTTAEINVYFTALAQQTVTYNLTNATVSKIYSPATYIGKTASTETTDYVQSGTKAVITVAPISGYRITTFTVDGVSGTENEDGTWSYTINQVTSNVEVVATAAKLYTVSVDSSLANGSIAISTEKDEGQAVAGEIITLTSINPDLDYTFSDWSYNSTTALGNTFIMPEADTTVSASFTAIDTVAISYSVYDTNGSADGGTNGSIAAEVTRKYNSGEAVSGYPITNSNGSLTVNRGYTDAYAAWPASVVTFKATPNSGYIAKHWYINGVEVTAETANCTTDINTLTLTAVQGAAPSYNVQVQYDLIGNKITYSAADAHGTITGAILTSEYNELTEIKSGDTLTIGGTIAFTAVPISADYQVEGWYVNGVKQEGETGTEYVYTATAGIGAVVTVKFERVSYTVTYSGVNGTVTAAINSISMAGSPAQVVGDSVVTFTASANAGYAFGSWTINGEISNVNTNVLTLPITADTTVTASFIEDENCSILYNVTGTGGTLSATKGGSEFTSGSTAAANDVIIFTATPETVANDGSNNYRVASWTVGANTFASNDTKRELTVTEATTVSVTFERYDYVVTYSVTGAGNGQISAISDSKNIESLGRVNAGRDVTFTATPANGYQVKSWTIDDTTITTENTSYTINGLSADTTVQVEFEQLVTYTISITTSGTGYGSVTAKEGAAEAVANATTITVPRHGTVTLTAMRYDTNNAFNGWTVLGNVDTIVEKNGIVLNLKDVTENITVDAAFKPATMVELSASEDDANGTLNYSGIQVGYLSANLISTVDLSASSSVQITSGMDVVIGALPDEGYMVKEWIVNGEVQDELSSTLSLHGVSVDTTIEVTFEPIMKYSIPSSGDPANGEYYTVTPGLKNPNDIGSNTEIRDRGTVTFTVAPNDGYYFTNLTIFGVDCLNEAGSAAGTTENIVSVAAGNDGSYTITAANVKANLVYSISTAKPIVNITAPTNGTIAVTYVDGSGNTQTVTTGSEIPAGTELTITATADTGYSLGAWGDAAAGKYGTTIKLIVPGEDITISAAFVVPIIGGGGGFLPPIGVPTGTEQVTTNTVTGNNGTVTITVTAKVDATVNSSTAAVSVDEAMEKTLIEQIKAAEEAASSSDTISSSVVINALLEAAVTETNIEVPVSALNSIVDETSATMTLVTNTAQLVLDQTALSAIAKEASGDKVTFSVEEVDKTTLPGAVQKAIGDAYVLDLKVVSSNGTISSFAGGTATVRVPVPKAMSGSDMKVVYIADDGTLTEVTGSIITINGVEYYEFSTGHFSHYALVKDTSLPFIDVADDDWYYSAVGYVYRNKLITGTTSTTFEPNATTTRAMLVTVLWRLAGEPAANSSSFTDVATGAWYSTAVVWAAENNIVNGIGGGLFAPNDSITREQMAVILYNYACFMDYDVSLKGDTSIFTDRGKVSSWAIGGIEWAVGSELISGKGDGILDPIGTATRAEIATILMRFIENSIK